MSKKLGLTPSEIPENIYGHKKRLLWMMEKINKYASDRPKSDIKILEIGCGTGVMISIPLASLGYNVLGVDPDRKSIDLADSVNTFENARFMCTDASELNDHYDFIILSEVLEHLDAPETLLKLTIRLLTERGTIIVTVPNGYGWFEFEQFLWEKLRLGGAIERLKIMWVISMLKQKLTGREESALLSSFSTSPHIQRFTLSKIKKMIYTAGFRILEIDGSALFSGKFSNLLFTGFKLPLRINNTLGSFFKPIASGFYLCCCKQ
jgi:2-polyprenyl-3-methyl-5-hydroxy-6-metoxy-1,4-benzoquinol methylase